MLSRTDLASLATALGGLPILGCLEGSPAAEAGVRYGDILLSINGTPTPTWDAFIEVRSQCGERMVARIFRNGVERDIEMPLHRARKSPIELLGEVQKHGIAPAPTSLVPKLQH